MDIKEIRKRTGLSQRKFAEITDIPLSSLQHWEQNVNKPPKYVLSMLEKALKYDGFIVE